ncbi:histidine kinase dimerization/phospho-acceptor domain-containing protein, partial [Streptomyces sparsus]
MVRHHLRSVRAQATIGATTVVALALVAAGTAVLWLLQANLSREVELRAEVRARDAAGQIATGTELGELSLDGPVQIFDDQGRVRAVSEDLESVTGTAGGSVTPLPGRSPSPSASPTPTVRPSPTPVPRDDADADADDDDDGADDADDDDDDDSTPAGSQAARDGQDDADDDDRPGPGEVGDSIEFTDGTATEDGERRDYRFAVAEARTPQGEALTVYAGAELAVEQAALGTVRTALLVGSPLLLVVVAVTTWRVTRRALRPVEGIRREMAEITRSTDLSRRVPEPAVADEVGRLARTTNETLAALEGSVERQRRFVADASHELRSPIASLRTQLEVGQAHPDLLDVAGAVQDTVRLQDLAADLLLLARLDAGERRPDRRVALAALVGEELAGRREDRCP